MNVTKLDQLLQYALVVTAQGRHGVTLTQLVKYAYWETSSLQDTTKGRRTPRQNGSSYTLDLGQRSVQDRVPDSMDAIGARADEFEVEDGGHGVSYSLDGPFDDCDPQKRRSRIAGSTFCGAQLSLTLRGSRPVPKLGPFEIGHKSAA